MTDSIKEDAFFPLSAINHYSFCPRRCALVHLEQVWNDNYFTASGNELHAKVDAGGLESRRERRFARSLRLFSAELGVSGIADMVEFRRDEDNGVPVSSWPGRWLPYPVEYKWGTAKNEIPYERQLCAQAMCLEEMFHVSILEGALYLGVTKHRRTVALSDQLRSDTRQVCASIRELLSYGYTPPAQFGPYCKSCSLIDQCLPKMAHQSAKKWLIKEMKSASK